MTTVAIVGAGEIGGATAQALASRHRIRRVLLVDIAAEAAAGKALDIQQAGAIEGAHTALVGTADESRITGCAACIIADRFGGGEWRGDDALAMLVRLARYLGEAPFVFAGVSQHDLLGSAACEESISRTRLIGSRTEALVSALTAIVSMEAGCSPREIRLTVLGVPPAGFVVPWGEASIGGYAMARVLPQVQMARIEARVARLWPPGPYALGAAAARIAGALLSNSLEWFSVLTQLGGEFGVKGRVGAIAGTRVPELDRREQVRVQVALGG
jgi:malate dehydrogenase